ncbi:MAG: hypothetical protein AAF916_09155 [Planctomycetota bacterium]
MSSPFRPLPPRDAAVPLRLLNGSQRRAVVKGFTAAWLCDCGHPEPLLGTADAADSASVCHLTDCPACGKRYRVVAKRRRSRPMYVEEIEALPEPTPSGTHAHA